MRTPMLLVVAALALAPPAAAPPSGDPSNVEVEEARKHFNEGVRLSASGKAGEVAQALDEFQKAYDLIPNWRILYNIGQTSRHVRDHARSVRAFTRYLAEGKDEIPRARRQEVEREVAALEPLVARLELAGSEDGAEVQVDDKPAGQMPLAESLYLNAGSTRCASAAGQATLREELDLAGGKSERLEISSSHGGGGPATKPTATATPDQAAAPAAAR